MDSREFAMPKKISAVKIRRTFTPERRLALMLIIGSVTFVLTERISAETPSPVTMKDVFDPDLAEVILNREVKQAIKDETEKDKPNAEGCYAAATSTLRTYIQTLNEAAL